MLNNDVGDELELTTAAGPIVAASAAPVASLISAKCLRVMGQKGLDLERMLALPATINVKLVSPIATSYETLSGIDNFLVVATNDNPTGHTAAPAGLVWIDGDTGECGTQFDDELPRGPFNLKPSTSSKYLWHGWILMPGITPQDPTGANSSAHLLLFGGLDKFSQLGGRPPKMKGISGTTLVSCGNPSSAADGYMPIDSAYTLQHGCTPAT